MNNSKNIVTMGLMISSVLLLVVLQFFWLRGSYEKAFFDFRRETSMLFRGSVFNIRDSLFVRNIEPVKGDTAKFMTAIAQMDSLKLKLSSSDTLIDHIKVKDGSSRVQVFVTSTDHDSIADFLKPLASTMTRWDGQRSFIIRMGPDTLNIDTLSDHYSKALNESGIDASFTISHRRVPRTMRQMRRINLPGDPDRREEDPSPNIYQDTLSTEGVQLNPMNSYSASFTGMRTVIIKEIAPQILFSCFLTFIIVASFLVMYRNLRSQQRLMELKNDFINNVTHELKTPVATVSVALEALKDFNALENRERTKEYLDIAQNELNRLTLMTDKILKASAFENQGVSFEPVRVNIHQIIEQVISSMKLVFDKKKLIVNYNSEGSDFELEGSEVHLTNVVYNLIDNALKYSSENSTIDIQLKNGDDHLELTIRDYGIGIPKAYHKKIFEKFFRVPTGDVHNVKGYGLGLNYVASVIKSHRGTIDLESEPGKGSSFFITIPRKHG